MCKNLQITFLTFPVIQQLRFSQLTSQRRPAKMTGHIKVTLEWYARKMLIFCHVYRYVITLEIISKFEKIVIHFTTI